MGASSRAGKAATAILLGLATLAVAHGHEDEAEAKMDMDMGAQDVKPDPSSYAPTYFAHPEHTGLLYAHIALMVVAWISVLPISVMLSLARSRYRLLAQLIFLTTNAIGLLFGTIYNANTPDLYPNNAHHKLGWILTWIVCAQVVVGLLDRFADLVKLPFSTSGRVADRRSYLPVSVALMAEHHRLNELHYHRPRRLSNDSGQGTEPNTESLRGNSLSSIGRESPDELRGLAKEFEQANDEAEEMETIPLSSRPSDHWVVRWLSKLPMPKFWQVVGFAYNVVDRVILILGFVALCTGIVTYGRFFEGHQIFTGLAHWIKGGIFFWLGILTLGRWSGSFGEFGWAWNLRPKLVNDKWRPSAEFVESALIFTYGSTNIFLEHLGNYGEGYSAQDLEHISITVLFIGGGLCGMLIESTFIRELLNTTVTDAALRQSDHSFENDSRETLQPPKTYRFSLNPIPALVILLLGIMMSSHTQTSMISSMVHKQWGNLLLGASFARAFTYVLLYLKPPRSILPSRPPTELLASFGLISGGIIFMASSGDTVDGMVHYELDAMFMYTVTMGFVGLLMAWVIIVLAIKGWATRKEAGRPASAYRLEESC